MNFERRYVTADFEVRGEPDSSARVVFGHGAVWNKRSSALFDPRLGSFVEEVRQGAFKKTLLESDVRAFYNHNPELILGRRSAGTLRLEEDAVGLAYNFDVPDTSAGRDLVVSMQRGDVTQSSFGFGCIEDDWSTTEKGNPLRSLVEVALHDVAPVSVPAYPDADSGLRSALSHLAESRSISVDEAVAITRSGQLSDLIEKRHVDMAEVRALDAKMAAEMAAMAEEMAKMPAGMPPDMAAKMKAMAAKMATMAGMGPGMKRFAEPTGPVDATLSSQERRLALYRRRHGAA